MLAQSVLQRFAFAGIFVLTATISRGDSEIVAAIRYLQPKGTSHSHLYLYREDGKLLRQLTTDNSGQDSHPIFASDGAMIVFTREKPNDVREFWSIDPRGAKLKKLDAAPDWYSAAKLALFHEWRRRGGPVIFTNSAAGRVRLACRDRRERRAAGTFECDSIGCCD